MWNIRTWLRGPCRLIIAFAAAGTVAAALAGDATLREADTAAPDADRSVQPAPPAEDPTLPAGEAASAATQPSPPTTAALIRIEGMIYGFVLESLQRRITRARAGGADIIVIELDTPGGAVDSALKISRNLKLLEDVQTVAWVNSEAYSAGIMIAAACDRIVMSPASATGDCAPIMLGGDLAATERAKALSPILEEFADSARRHGYDYAMFHAMCVLGVEVYQIEHKQSGQVRLVNQVDYRVMVKGESREDVLQAATPAKPTADPEGGPVLAPIVVAPPTLDVATKEDIGQWKLVRQVHDGGTLLTVNQTRAEEMGLSKATIRTEDDLRRWLGADQIVRVRQSWSENLAGWLTHPAVRAVLIMAVLLGAYMEFQSPGLGVPGAVAVVALVVLLGAPFLIGLSEIWHLVLFLAGVALLCVELLLTPGFAVMGIAGVLLMIAGLVLAVVPTSGPFRLPAPGMGALFLDSLLWTLGGMVASGVGLLVLINYLGVIPGFDRLVLKYRQVAAMGAGAPAFAPMSGDEVLGGGTVVVGAVGRVVSELRPTGRADIDGRLVDVVSYGDWLEPGRAIRVSEVAGNRIVVVPA